MNERLSSIAALLCSFFIMCLGNGLLNTIIGLRATSEGYPLWVIGLMTSGYYVGFALGTYLCAKLIFIVGHIRTFAVFASVASAVSVGFVLFVEPAFWLASRVMYGICIASLYLVLESWLSAVTTNSDRGRIFAIYVILSYIGLSAGQLFVLIASPSEFTLFAITSILLSFSLVPLSSSKSIPPTELESERFGFKKLLETSTLATFGCFASGLILGAFWGFGPVYLSVAGMADDQIAWFISLTFLGGILLQWPLGSLSDKLDRRVAIVVTALIGFLASTGLYHYTNDLHDGMNVPLAMIALAFGGTNYILYSMFICLVHDFLKPQQRLRANGGMLSIHAIGAIVGPIFAAPFLELFGPKGFIVFMMMVGGFIVFFGMFRAVVGRAIPESTSRDFKAYPRTGVFSLVRKRRKKKQA